MSYLQGAMTHESTLFGIQKKDLSSFGLP